MYDQEYDPLSEEEEQAAWEEREAERLAWDREQARPINRFRRWARHGWSNFRYRLRQRLPWRVVSRHRFSRWETWKPGVQGPWVDEYGYELGRDMSGAAVYTFWWGRWQWSVIPPWEMRRVRAFDAAEARMYEEMRTYDDMYAADL
jgi:hypothetical protein